MSLYQDMPTDRLIREINKLNAKIPKLKTQMGLWIVECGIKTIRAELDKRIEDPETVTKMILGDPDYCQVCGFFNESHYDDNGKVRSHNFIAGGVKNA